MTAKQAEKIIIKLRNAYPRDDMPTGTQGLYAKSIQDFTFEEADRAVDEIVATKPRMPGVSDLRIAVFEQRLQLPEPEEAWEDVQRHVFHRTPMRRCVQCAGFGTKTGGDEPCEHCRGVGEVPVEKRPSLDTPVQRALDSVGGAWAVRTTDSPGIVHAQFLKAYDSFRRMALREANLRSLGVLEPAARRIAGLPRAEEDR